MRFLVSLAKAVVKNSLNLLLDGLPFGNALCDIAKDTWGSYRQPKSTDAQTVADMQELAQAPAPQLRQEAEAAAREAAPDQPPQVQRAVAAYLTQVPTMIRRVSRRPSDQRGLTVPAALVPRKAEDLQRLLPSRPPRFKPGDRPLPGIDWELEELQGIGGFGEVWKAHRSSGDIIQVAHPWKEGSMDVKQLMSWVDQPETHRKIVGDYPGSYALGVTDNPPAFLLRVEPADVSRFPTVVNLHGVEVPVVVRGEFVPPVPITRLPRAVADKTHN